MVSNGVRLLALSLAIFGVTVTSVSAAPSLADLGTYTQESGKTYFALSLTPPAAAQQDQPRDVVILFNTSASQAGPYRDTALAAVEACIAKLHPQDRVQIFAADLQARPITNKFWTAGSPELRAALEALRRESPLGATDMENVLRTAVARFEKDQPNARVLLYIGDGRSSANLIGNDVFSGLVTALTGAKIAVSSYAIGPQINGQFLAALSNQTGGNLYVAEQVARANDAEKITDARANDENVRRGASVGAQMANWVRAAVYWPTAATWPAELGQVYPKAMPPLRADRDTIVIGGAAAPLNKPIEVRAQVVANGKPSELHWSATAQNKGEAYAFLPQLVDEAKHDGGLTTVSYTHLTLPTILRV